MFYFLICKNHFLVIYNNALFQLLFHRKRVAFLTLPFLFLMRNELYLQDPVYRTDSWPASLDAGFNEGYWISGSEIESPTLPVLFCKISEAEPWIASKMLFLKAWLLSPLRPFSANTCEQSESCQCISWQTQHVSVLLLIQTWELNWRQQMLIEAQFCAKALC